MLPRKFWKLPTVVRGRAKASGRSASKRFARHQPCGDRRRDDFGAQVNFQVTVLKILVSYPDGFAHMEELKRDMAILATSGRDWAERTKRLGARVPDLNIFSQALIERVNGGWRITQKGRSVLAFMEARTAPADSKQAAAPDEPKLVKSPQAIDAAGPSHARRPRRTPGEGRRGNQP